MTADAESGAWQPIETAIEAAKLNDGWFGPFLFGKQQHWGWESWVGQCDDGNIWLGRCGDGSCFECEKPTHYQPLPEPPK